jgi:hypothetical protein
MNFRRLLPPAGGGPLVVADFLNSTGMALFITGGTLFLTRAVGLSIVETSVLLTVAGFFGLVTTLPLGHLADLIGPRAVTVGLLGVRAGATAVLALRPEPAVLYACVAVVMVGDRGIQATFGALTAAVGGAQRVRLQAYLRAVTNVGFTVGSLLATPFLAVDTPGAYVTLMVVDAALVAVAAPTLLGAASVPGVAAERREKMLTAARDRPYLVVTALHAVLSLQYEILAYALPLWVTFGTDAPPWLVAVLFATASVLVAALQVPMSAAASTVRSAAVLGRRSGGLFLLSTGLLGAAHLTSGAATVVVLFAGVLVHTLGELWQAASSFTLSFDLAREHAHGQYQAVFALGRGLERTLAPALLGVLCLRWGPPGWLVLGVLLLAAGALLPAAAARAAAAKNIVERTNP